jgi:hypothetical protein
LRLDVEDDMTRNATAAALLIMLAPGPVTKTSTSSAVALRIESLSQREVRVQVTSQPAGLWLDSASAAEPQLEIVARTPAALRVADSVRTLNVLVLEGGAVRLRFGEGAPLQDRRLAAWGRDITLTRGPDGHFHSVWKAQRLVP